MFSCEYCLFDSIARLENSLVCVSYFHLQSLSAISVNGIVPGLDNKMSSFMRQKGLKTDDNFWLERWYVLNSHSLLCFSTPEVSLCPKCCESVR